MDFTIKKYTRLLETLKNNGYNFQTFHEYLTALSKHKKVVIIRHDIDLKPGNALLTGEVEYNLDLKASYYFRIINKSFAPEVIKSLQKMNHEIGYHYEELSMVNGNIDKAYELFKANLEKIRSVADIKTMCMHGSPMSKWDNKKVWGKYDYKNLGIIGDPAFDFDFQKFFYITDTGRKWNSKAGVRDCAYQKSSFDIPIKNTKDFIKKVKNGELPDFIMINAHSQRWSDNYYDWLHEFIYQNIKNVAKRILIKLKQ